MNLDLLLVDLDEFAGSMKLSEEIPRWIWASLGESNSMVLMDFRKDEKKNPPPRSDAMTI